MCLDIKVLDAEGAEIELRDEEEEGYQNFNQIKDDYYPAYNEENQFSAAGFTFKESSDDDDLGVSGAEEDAGDEAYDEE